MNPAGFTVHAAIHDNIPDAHCVMHTHTTAGIAVACTQGGLAQNNFYSAQLHGLVAYHDFEGITIHADEAPAPAEEHRRQAGGHPAQPWTACPGAPPCRWPSCGLWTLQRACEVQVTQAALGPAIPVPETVAQQTVADSFQWDQRFGAGQDVFDALVRRVDRIDASYKT